MSGGRPPTIDNLFSNRLRLGILDMQAMHAQNQRERSETYHAQAPSSNRDASIWEVGVNRQRDIPLRYNTQTQDTSKNKNQGMNGLTHLASCQCIAILLCIGGFIAVVVTLIFMAEHTLQTFVPTLNAAQPLLDGIRQAVRMASSSELPKMLVNETVPLLQVARNYLEHPPVLHIAMSLGQ